MTRAKRPLLSLVIAIVLLAIAGLVVWKVPPTSVWVEVLVSSLIAVAATFCSSWIFGNTKRGIQMSVALIGLLLMQRLRILDWPTLGLWLVVMGLISLVG